VTWQPKPRPQRGPHDSSTEFGQYIHDQLERKFNAIDDDRVVYVTKGALKVYARSTGILRHLEHFYPGAELSDAQKETLPLLAACFWYGVQQRVIQPGSGVFTIEAAAPFESGEIRPQLWHPTSGFRVGEPFALAGAEFARFIGTYDGRVVDLRKEAA
jgi:hypothetical protein